MLYLSFQPKLTTLGVSQATKTPCQASDDVQKAPTDTWCAPGHLLHLFCTLVSNPTPYTQSHGYRMTLFIFCSNCAGSPVKRRGIKGPTCTCNALL